MAKGIRILIFLCAATALFWTPAFAEALTCEIQSVTAYRALSEYDIEDTEGGRKTAIYVCEYPVFSGSAAVVKKCEAVYPKPGDGVRGVREFKRVKNQYTYDDYYQELARSEDEEFYDITTCSVYQKNDVLSIVQQTDWYMGGILDLVYKCHTFDAETGNEIHITDVLKGSEKEILAKLQEAFEAEYEEKLDSPFEGGSFYLSSKGVTYVPADLPGYLKGALVLVPYSDTDFVKEPFSQTEPQE